MGNLNLLYTTPIFPTAIINAMWVKYIKCDAAQLEFDALFKNLSHFQIHKLFKALCHDYSKFGAKIKIDIRIQFKKMYKEKTLKHFATELLAQGFWVNCRSLLSFQKNNFSASDSSLGAQIFVILPKPYFNWYISAVKNLGQICEFVFNNYNFEI